jgi:hypothetical protein
MITSACFSPELPGLTLRLLTSHYTRPNSIAAHKPRIVSTPRLPPPNKNRLRNSSGCSSRFGSASARGHLRGKGLAEAFDQTPSPEVSSRKGGGGGGKCGHSN